MLEPIEGHPGAVAQDGDHADRGLVVLLALCRLGSACGVDQAAGGAAEALAVPARGGERGLADDAQNRGGALEVVDIPSLAVQAAVTGSGGLGGGRGMVGGG